MLHSQGRYSMAPVLLFYFMEK